MKYIRGPALLLIALSAEASAAGPPDFTKDIAPLLREHCVKCHGPEKQKGGLRFDVKSEALKKGDSGEHSIVAGKAAESELIRRITSTDTDLRMPSEGEPLTAAQIELLKSWIDSGASWPNDGQPVAKGEMVVTEEDREHWSFRPLSSPTPPDIAFNSEIDKFVVQSLNKAGLKMSPQASSRTLVRRIYFDLIGLPPRREEIAEFEAAYQQDSFAAVASLTDRLLATTHYGERWGRHWLDVARYADSDGQESDNDRPFAYQYRDFVIRSLNDDQPYDEFVRWQIAGDELAPGNPLANAATGFLIAGPHAKLDTIEMEDEKLRNRYDELDDTIATLGSSMLGLTLACTRCHDHKYDAIPTRDYYRLMAAFHSGQRQDVPLGSRAELQKYDQAKAEWDKQVKEAESAFQNWLTAERKPLDPNLRAEKIAALKASEEEKATLRDQPESDAAKKLAKKHEKALAISNDDLKRAMSDDKRRKWDELAAAVNQAKQAQPAAPPKAFAFRDDAAEPKPTWLFHRANYYDKSEPVQLGFLTVLTSAKSPEAYWQEAQASRSREGSTYQRAALAKWITDVEQGAGALLARVIVNRVWRHHFGEGIARTPSDFGIQGERPTHPELLEWLSNDFVASGWRLKRLHRQIILSQTYQQDSKFSVAAAQVDPENRLLWRRRPLRLEAEALRDAMLVCAGTMNREPFGPAFKPPIPAEAMVARNLKSPYNAEPPDSPNIRRRSVYMFHKRVVPYPLLQTFDRPDALQSCSRRDETTVAPQALAILNDPFVRDRAVEFAERLRKESGDLESAVRNAFAITLARSPSESELGSSAEFVSSRQAERQKRGMTEEYAHAAALADFCQTLFGLNEFLYVD